MASVRAVILHEALLKHLDEVRAALLFVAHPVLQVFVELGWRAHSIAIESARRTWTVEVPSLSAATVDFSSKVSMRAWTQDK